MPSKTSIILYGTVSLFTIWVIWYAVIGSVIGPLDRALYPMACQFPELMGWYPIMSSCINYAPVVVSFAVIMWMLFKGNADTYESDTKKWL
jgi:hypothetical protein